MPHSLLSCRIAWIRLFSVLACSIFFQRADADDPSPPVLAPSAATVQTPTPPTTNSPSTPENKTTWFDRWLSSFSTLHDQTSRDYLAMVRSIDSYFSGEKIEDSSNGSYLKLDIKNTFYKAGDEDSGISLNAKVDLPNTEKHLKFIFDTNPDEDLTLQQRIMDNAIGQRIQKENSIAGVEYSSDKSALQWQHSFSAGVKLRFDPIPFLRYKVDKNWQLGDGWVSEFNQSFWDYRDDGLGATTRINFGRPLTSKDYLKIETQAEYRDQDTMYSYAETITNMHILTATSAISYWIGALGQSQPTSEVTSYLLGLQYRRSLYRDWLLFSVNPLLTFPRAENWVLTPSLTLDLQIYFSQ